MSILLDTHVLLWWLNDDPRLPEPMIEILDEPTTTVHISAATAWEMSIKAALGKLTVPGDLREEVRRQGFEELPVTLADGLAAGTLPPHHNDPFDRMLIAQAQRRDLLLLTVDNKFDHYDVRLLGTSGNR